MSEKMASLVAQKAAKKAAKKAAEHPKAAPRIKRLLLTLTLTLTLILILPLTLRPMPLLWLKTQFGYGSAGALVAGEINDDGAPSDRYMRLYMWLKGSFYF